MQLQSAAPPPPRSNWRLYHTPCIPIERLLQGIALCLLLSLAACTGQMPEPSPKPPVSYFLDETATPDPPPTAAPTPTPVMLRGPVTTGIPSGLSEEILAAIRPLLASTTELHARNGPQPLIVLADVSNANAPIGYFPATDAQEHLLERVFAVVVPFETERDDISFAELAARWESPESGPLLVDEAAATPLEAIFGSAALSVTPADEFEQRLESSPDAIGLVAFERLHPGLKVLTVDGVNLLANDFDLSAYPLSVALAARGEGGPLLVQLLRPALLERLPYTNRDPEKLTVLLMTGVTAMSRGTAVRMEQRGVLYPAKVISATLQAADITHVSNEVPFLDDCKVNNSINNLILCSHDNYWAALEAIGTDIVGLSGNHVNDFGRDGAERSLQFYREHDIPIYGSGRDVAEACAPLLWTHNGNSFAFFGALAFGPPTAWATQDLPGACYFYDHKEELLDAIRKTARTVDVVAVELQYLETYNAAPTAAQVREFREVRAAGAHIVTGVQSHVPQSIEPYSDADENGRGIIVYGLGNLFFDQMWSWDTRTELMVRHIVYAGEVVSTEILTAVLEDYAQPRWATEQERRGILRRIFGATPSRIGR